MLAPRNFLLPIALVMMAAVGVGQAAAPASIPDFSGQWAHSSIPGVEPLASGPTAITNLARREGGVANNMQLVGDYKNPILKPESAEIVKRFGEMSVRNFGFPNPRNQCWPNGVPFVLPVNGMQMFQHEDHITIMYSVDHQVRHIRLNSAHPANVTPSWYGDAVAHYEGDTLVIDTIAVKKGPFPMIDWYGTPFSDKLHVVERYRLISYEEAKDGLERDAKENFGRADVAAIEPYRMDLNYRGKYLQLTFTVEDENVFTTPWSATVTYSRPTGPWLENVCAENPNKYGTEKDAQIPTAAKADF